MYLASAARTTGKERYGLVQMIQQDAIYNNHLQFQPTTYFTTYNLQPILPPTIVGYLQFNPTYNQLLGQLYPKLLLLLQ